MEGERSLNSQFIQINQLCSSTLYMSWLEEVVFLWVSCQRGRIIIYILWFHRISEQHIPMFWGNEDNEAYFSFSLSNPATATSFNWLPLLIVCSDFRRMGHTVRITCSKRQNSIIAMAKNAYLLYYIYLRTTICSSIQDIMEYMSKTACTSYRTIGTDMQSISAEPEQAQTHETCTANTSNVYIDWVAGVDWG